MHIAFHSWAIPWQINIDLLTRHNTGPIARTAIISAKVIGRLPHVATIILINIFEIHGLRGESFPFFLATSSGGDGLWSETHCVKKEDHSAWEEIEDWQQPKEPLCIAKLLAAAAILILDSQSLIDQVARPHYVRYCEQWAYARYQKLFFEASCL